MTALILFILALVLAACWVFVYFGSYWFTYLFEQESFCDLFGEEDE
jgi:hypothetical protein